MARTPPVMPEQAVLVPKEDLDRAMHLLAWVWRDFSFSNYAAAMGSVRSWVGDEVGHWCEQMTRYNESRA